MEENPAGLEDTQEREPRDRRLRHRICFLLDVGSVCLLAIFLLHLLPILIASQPLQAKWQNEFVATVLEHGLVAFAGFVALHLAVLVHPRKQDLRQRLRQVRHLAVIACVGFLLLIPLQLVSSVSQFQNLNAERLQNLAESSRLSERRSFLQGARSQEEILARLRSLSDAGLTPEQMAMTLPELRSTLLQENQQQQEVMARLIQQSAANFSTLTQLISRMGTALGWAVAFAAGAVPWGSRSTMLERVLRR